MLVSYLRPSKKCAARHAWAILKLLVERLRQAWPEVKIIVRGDSGFCRWKMLHWCEWASVDYIIGLAHNLRLEALGALLMAEAVAAFAVMPEKQRNFRLVGVCRRVVGPATARHRQGGVQRPGEEPALCRDEPAGRRPSALRRGLRRPRGDGKPHQGTATRALLSLPMLTSITTEGDGDAYANSGITLVANNGAKISAPLLATFTDNNAHPNSSISQIAGGMLVFTSLTQPGVNGVSLSGFVPPQNSLTLITSASTAASIVGRPFTYKIQTAKNEALSYAATGLPANLQLDSSTGVISGTSVAVGAYETTLSATNSQGTTEAELAIVINPPAPGIASGLIYSGLVDPAAKSAADLGGVHFTFTASGSYTVKLAFGGKVFTGKGKLDPNGNFAVTTWNSGSTAVSLASTWGATTELPGLCQERLAI